MTTQNKSYLASAIAALAAIIVAFTGLSDGANAAARSTTPNDPGPLTTPTPNPTPIPSSIVCEQVAWSNAVNVTTSANTINKTGGSWATWDAGAASKRAILYGNGYVEADVDALNTYRMFGLSNGDSNQKFNDIDFAAYLAGTTLKVYEKGVHKGTFGSIKVGDRVRVSVMGGVVRYYLNGASVYTSTAAPVYPLLLDTSINSSQGRLYNAMICGVSLGPNATFTPTSTRTRTGTPTNTFTRTSTPTVTNTPTITYTYTPTSTTTSTPTITLTSTPTPYSAYSDITTKPYGLPGVVNELTLHVWGRDSWRRGGDAYSPAFGAGPMPGGGYTPNPEYPRQPYGYLFKIEVPASYSFDRLSVELFDPDTYNKPSSPPNWPTPIGTSTTTPVPSADQYASCGNPRSGFCNSYAANHDNGMKLNAFPSGRPAFWRVDEIRTPYTDTGGIYGVYNPGFATTAQYTLWHFNPHNPNVYADPSTISDQPNGAYLSRYTTGWDATTDLSWYRPPGFDVQLTDAAGNDLFEREQNGGFYFYVYVQGIAGSSENDYDMRVGPPDLNSVNCSTAANCYVNQQYLDGIPDWQDGGAKLYAKRALPLNMVTGDSFPLLFTQVSRDLAGQSLGIRHFDQDCGGCGATMQYQMQLCGCNDLPDPACWANVAIGYVGDNNAWVAPPGGPFPNGYPDPEVIPIPQVGTDLYSQLFGNASQCPTSWLRIQNNPSYSSDSTVWEIPLLGPLLGR